MTTRLLVALGLMLGLCATAAAQAQIFTGSLDGLQETTPVVTTGTGAGTATYDPATNLLAVSLTFSDLIGTTTDSHIHCCFVDPPSRNAGVALGFTATFPLGVTNGTFNQTYNLLDPNVYNATFRNNNGGTAIGARDALLAGMTNGTAYFNIHTTFRASGEIRGDITPIPEPSSLVLVGMGSVAMTIVVRRRLRRTVS
ncbi:MAG: PEP-CTERM sorting domain-containing protein [Planctomycetota bacterium]|nr:MAG: PEP-CTERM sorting domain-containing protein [Planctomycetota bacterium]